MEQVTSRRSFLRRLWLGLGLVALVEWIAVVVMFLRPRARAAESDSSSDWHDAGSVVDYAPGTVTAFVQGRFFLVRLPDGGFLALSRRCTHLGCTVQWSAEQARFLCPCHASAFDMQGEVTAAPAPHALELHPLRIERDAVQVDTANLVRRRHFKPEQVVYPA